VAKAGSLSIYAVPQNVKVYRDVDGKRELGNINLADSSMFNSPYFYLKNNDVVYVPPQEEKVKSIRRQQDYMLVNILFTMVNLALAIIAIVQ
jgi:polysaccharide export outer membrane protein